MVEVRLLGPDDLDLVLGADADVFDGPPQAGSAAAFLGDPRHHLVGAIADGVLVGFASAVDYLRPDKPRDLFVCELGVAQAFHRQGIGLRLLQVMLAHGQAIGCASAWVGTEMGNAPARALYRAAGGVPDAEPAEILDFALAP